MQNSVKNVEHLLADASEERKNPSGGNEWGLLKNNDQLDISKVMQYCLTFVKSVPTFIEMCLLLYQKS